LSWAEIPAVDIAEKDKAYEVIAELPGLDENNIEVKVANDVLTIKDEKRKRRRKRGKTTITPSVQSPKAPVPAKSKPASRRVC
jgi:HSP20 family molecular chaperone IbpA